MVNRGQRYRMTSAAESGPAAQRRRIHAGSETRLMSKTEAKPNSGSKRKPIQRKAKRAEVEVNAKRALRA